MGAGPGRSEELPRGSLSVYASEPVSVGVGEVLSFRRQRVVGRSGLSSFRHLLVSLRFRHRSILPANDS